MPAKSSTIAHVIQSEAPDWGPLERLVEAEIVGAFMWMFELETSDGRRIHAYKHIDTRRYVHLSTEGETFVYRPEARYLSVDPGQLLRQALGLADDRDLHD